MEVSAACSCRHCYRYTRPVNNGSERFDGAEESARGIRYVERRSRGEGGDRARTDRSMLCDDGPRRCDDDDDLFCFVRSSKADPLDDEKASSRSIAIVSGMLGSSLTRSISAFALLFFRYYWRFSWGC